MKRTVTTTATFLALAVAMGVGATTATAASAAPLSSPVSVSAPGKATAAPATAPRSVRVVSVAKSGAVTLSWKSPKARGNVHAYWVKVSGAPHAKITVKHRKNSATVNGLLPGKTYTLMVAAKSKTWGAYSTPITVTIPSSDSPTPAPAPAPAPAPSTDIPAPAPTVDPAPAPTTDPVVVTAPSAPTRLTAASMVLVDSKRNIANLTFTWTAPKDNGGAAITGYTVNAQPWCVGLDRCNNSVSSENLQVSGDQTQATIPVVTHSSWNVTLVAHNAGGYDSPVATGTFSTERGDYATQAPAAVTGLKAHSLTITGPHSNGHNAADLILVWDAPSAADESAVTGYTVSAEPWCVGDARCMVSPEFIWDQETIGANTSVAIPVYDHSSWHVTITAYNAAGKSTTTTGTFTTEVSAYN